MPPRRLAALLLTLAVVGTVRASDAQAPPDPAWKVHREHTCGIELKYPAPYVLEAAGAADACEPWMRIGPRDGRGVRAVFTLEVRTASSAQPARSVRDLALQVATAQCGADGPDSSTSCINAELRAPFTTPLGFHGVEIHMVEVNEESATGKIVKRPRAPVFALDLSDGEIVRVLLATADAKRTAELKAILDTFRVWKRIGRPAPRVVEMRGPRPSPPALSARVTTDEEFRASRWPPAPVTSWLLTDPQGRRLGRDPATGMWLAEAPAITQSTAVESGFMLRETLEGRYRLDVRAAVPSAHYQVTVQAPDQHGTPTTARMTGRTGAPGSADHYELVYSPASAPVLQLREMVSAAHFRVLLSSKDGVTAEAVVLDPRGQPVAAGWRTSQTSDGTSIAVLDVPQPSDGAYILRVPGRAAGRYTLDLRASDRAGRATVRPELRDIPTEAGVVQLYRLDYAGAGPVPLTLRGRFEKDRLLAYANPMSSETKVTGNVSSFALVIFYADTIDPVSFSALLNGTNVSGRFTPERDGHEIVRIPLGPGLNTLRLSVEGSLDGRPGVDTQRLIFRVE